mmetsp:Transcript_14773/g.19332  ORF Transcript_14773/g.19332 Transcript_14773/m.19332 type:complete len:220 (-) Transcript_14773:138-797(-)|eukprot:CAMPEP_0198144684 /NCGR_PEP_ID=MMETSP1443-20131203/17785_1 /TAXON_ID=186043 /ORGANISM="Entomoneis sp., Strain CCMP2396" /LENGTH=219 /DNA_ID=CAMNT_0043808131 /DNA_START=82 /DNA_END=741 /DNA_ORIENTATION=-
MNEESNTVDYILPLELNVAADDSKLKTRRNRQHRMREYMVYPVPPTEIVSLEKPYNIVNHSYRDFSQVPSQINWEGVPHVVTDMSFPLKLHWLIQHPLHSSNSEWRPHGRAFVISMPNILRVKGVYRNIFECSGYAVFITMLRSWGFKHITHGKDRNCWYHELFIRGLPHLAQYFDDPRDARTRLPDPGNEPDLYAISEKYPVPEVATGRMRNNLLPDN